jgi:predicted nucleic acid-binding protein
LIVLDSSFLIAFHNESDVHHSKAVPIMDRLLTGEWGSALLLEYVFLEVMTVLRMRLDLQSAVSVAEALLRAREIEFVPCSEVFTEAFETLRTERDSALSFVDAAITAVARRNPPGLVATFDNDFSVLDGLTLVR